MEWHELALYFIANLEAELSNNPYNSEARELLEEVKAYPDMPRTITHEEPPKPYLELTATRDDLTMSFFTVVSTFDTPQDVTLQELRIETFFPADTATEDILKSS